MSTNTPTERQHSRVTPWLWAWLASIMAFLAVGVLVSPAAATVPDALRGTLLVGSCVMAGATTVKYLEAERRGETA
jgi:hypothetical protein